MRNHYICCHLGHPLAEKFFVNMMVISIKHFCLFEKYGLHFLVYDCHIAVRFYKNKYPIGNYLIITDNPIMPDSSKNVKYMIFIYKYYL